MLPTLYTKSDSSAELSNFNLSKYACLDFMLFTYWEPQTVKKTRICSDGKLQWACLSQYTCIYMNCQHMHYLHLDL